jgi:hypothetical protein
MRAQKASARAGEYNARRGKEVVRDMDANGGPQNARDRRRYNAALGAINAQSREAENAYGSTFAGLDEGAKEGKLLGAAGLTKDASGNIIANSEFDGKLDGDMLIAGLKSMRNTTDMGKTMKAISGTQAFQDLVARDGSINQRLASVMSASDGNVVNQSVGKLLADGKNFNDIYANDSELLRNTVQGVNANVMANQKAEVFDSEGGADLFSDDQLRVAAAAGYSGDHQEKFYNMMKNVSSGRKERIVSGVTANQVGSLRVSLVGGHDHGSLAAVGGADLVKSANPDAINQIKGEEGRNIRINQQGDAARALGTNVTA